MHSAVERPALRPGVDPGGRPHAGVRAHLGLRPVRCRPLRGGRGLRWPGLAWPGLARILGAAEDWSYASRQVEDVDVHDLEVTTWTTD